MKTRNHPARLLCCSTILSVTLLAPVAGAQENPETTDDESSVLLDLIEISTSLQMQGIPTDQPAATSHIDRERLRESGGRKLDDALRSVPGSFTRENPQQPGVAVNIRGFEGSGRVTTTVDGVRQNFRFTSHEAAGFTYVDPAFLAGADIRRGAVSTAGGGGLAGAVGFRTLGVDDVIPEGRDRGVISRMQWGSNGVGPSEMVAGAFRSGNAGFLLGLSARSSDDFKNAEGDRQDNTGQELRSGLLKSEFDFGDGHRLTFGGLYYWNEFAANSYEQRVNNRTATIGYRYDPADNNLIDLRANLYHNEIVMTYLRHATTGAPAEREIRDRGLGFDLSNVSQGMIGAVAIRSENGIEYFRDKVTSVDGGVNPADGTAKTAAIFTENTFTHGPFEAIAALRYDHYQLNGSANAGGAIGHYKVDQSTGRLNPRLTVAWQANDWLQPYVTWSQSMRAPTIQETMTGGDHPDGSAAAFLPNPHLRPEHQRGWEIGANIQRDDLFRPGDNLAIKANYFQMQVTDYIAGRMDPSVGGYRFVNIDGRSRLKGVEIAARYDTGIAYAELAYTHTDSRLPHPQPGLGAVSQLPDDIVTLTAGTRLMDQRLHLGGRMHYVSNSITLPRFDPDLPESGPGYTLVDVFAAYEFRDNAEISLRVTNLFNRSHTPALSTIGSGQGRTAYLAANFRF